MFGFLKKRRAMKEPFLCEGQDGKTYEVTPTILRESLIIYLSGGEKAVLGEDVIAYVYSKEEQDQIAPSEQIENP